MYRTVFRSFFSFLLDLSFVELSRFCLVSIHLRLHCMLPSLRYGSFSWLICNILRNVTVYRILCSSFLLLDIFAVWTNCELHMYCSPVVLFSGYVRFVLFAPFLFSFVHVSDFLFVFCFGRFV